MQLTDHEAHELMERVRALEPDFRGHYMENYRVQTSVGDALLRRARTDVFSGYDPRMMPESDALIAARHRGVNVPEVLYAADSYLIERYLCGSLPSMAGSDPLSWLTDLLSQVQAMQSHPAPASPLSSVYEWQNWMAHFLSSLYAELPQRHTDRIAYLGVPPLDAFWRPDSAQSARRLVLVHADLHPDNLLVADDGVWILDWELAQVADPVWEAAVSLHRTPWPDLAMESQASAMWLHVLDSTEDVAVDELLVQYRGLETWKSLLVDSWRYPEAIASDPSCLDSCVRSFHVKLAEGARRFGCTSLSTSEVRQLLQNWAAT
ncbi:aminoglycoside phosphotransferase family protein [Nocardia arthritidis]|uniref:aminoglycoside phosphotransferase family protein n=1 Tax=Nocardia arthritidis TaxID=228602 RepID=UPI00142E5F0D|nr:aminoglycoside phosphotransferase family protein [Nocardia arthritidis]